MNLYICLSIHGISLEKAAGTFLPLEGEVDGWDVVMGETDFAVYPSVPFEFGITWM